MNPDVIKVTIEQKDYKLELSLSEAKKLFVELGKLFPNCPLPVKQDTYNPYNWYYGSSYKEKEVITNYTINI